MRLLLAAGGTGGHVIPALVIAREWLSRDPAHRVLFVGTPRGLENRLVPAAGLPLNLLDIGALKGQSLAARAATLFALPRALLQAWRILRHFRPDVVLGVGGYAAGPVLLATAFQEIPLVVLEPNAVPGLAHRWVAPFVRRAFLGFPEAAAFFGPHRALLTGIPVRREFFTVAPPAHRPPFAVLIFGGSQGSRTLNRAVVEALPRLARFQPPLALLHQTGQTEYNAVREAFERHSMPGEVFPYRERMWEAFERADVIICRAGAATIAELAAAGRATVLVPYPAAADEHQLRNAQALARLGAVRLVLDRDLNGDTLCAVLADLLSAPDRLRRMETAVRRWARPDAAAQIVDELERLAVVPPGAASPQHLPEQFA